MKPLKDRNEEKRGRLRKKKSRGDGQIERNEKKRVAVRLISTFPGSPFFIFFRRSDHTKQIILSDLSLFMHSTRYEKEDADRYSELIETCK